MPTGPTFPLVHTYLFFGGRCEEALAFYGKAVGAKVQMSMKFSDSPTPPPPGQLAPGFENKIMHCDFYIGDNHILASDGCGPESKFDGFRMVLSLATEAEADKAFAALVEGGKVDMPLAKTFWSPKYGMLTDKFGLGWMVMVPGAPPA